MGDPAIIAAGRPSDSGRPPSIPTIHSNKHQPPSKAQNRQLQGPRPLEDQLRGMIQNHGTTSSGPQNELQNGHVKRKTTCMTTPARFSGGDAVTHDQHKSLVDSPAQSQEQQANGKDRTSQAPNAAAQTTIAAHRRILAARIPPPNNAPNLQVENPEARKMAEFEQRDPSAGRQLQSNLQVATSSEPTLSPDSPARRSTKQARRQRQKLSLKDFQNLSTEANPLSMASEHSASIHPTPPHLRQVAKPQQILNGHSASTYAPPPHLQHMAKHHYFQQGLTPHQQQPQRQQYGQPQYPQPPYRLDLSAMDYGAQHVSQPGLGHYAPPPHQTISSPNSQWHNNIQLQPQPQWFGRSNPQQRQLYDSNSDRRPDMSQKGEWLLPHALVAQANFLDRLVLTEVPKVQITSDELEEKEQLRLELQEVCQAAIIEYELVKDATFDGSAVALKCFGSVGSGFAMTGSDMDLALLSPASSPEPASPESEIPRLLEKKFLDSGYGARLLTKTRVPIIRFCEKPTIELAEALLKARSKWEMEKDEPPKTKEPEKHKKETFGHSNVTNTATHMAPEITNESDIAEIEPSVEVEEPLDPQKLRQDIVDNATDTLEDLKIGENSKTTSSEAKDVVPANTNPGKVISHEVRTPVEPKTDDELVRLYGLAMSEGWFDPVERAIIIRFISAVKSQIRGGNNDLTNIRHSLQSLPDVLSRYREPYISPLDLPKTGVGIQCDINFSNHLAIHNTHMLKCYALCDERVQPMVIFVKAWAKSRNINSPYHGTLSSYGYVLMVLHYLVNVAKPAIVPNLQRIPRAMQDTSPENDQIIDGYTVRFWRNEADIRNVVASGGLSPNRTDTIGSLLRGFYQYYAHPSDGGFNWGTDVLSLRTVGGLLRKHDKGWTGAKTITTEPANPGEDAKEIRYRYLFAIEDPFETEHNIARTVVHNGIVAIRNEFRRAHRIIQSQSWNKPIADGDLFAEAESKEHLQYRYFGPLIPNFGKEKATSKNIGEKQHSQGGKQGKHEKVQQEKKQGEKQEDERDEKQEDERDEKQEDERDEKQEEFLEGKLEGKHEDKQDEKQDEEQDEEQDKEQDEKHEAERGQEQGKDMMAHPKMETGAPPEDSTSCWPASESNGRSKEQSSI